MVTLYKLILNDENLKILKENGYKEHIEENLVVYTKKKKVPEDSDLVDFSRTLYNNQDWIWAMQMSGIKLADYGLTYEEVKMDDGNIKLILVETEEYRKNVIKFEMYIDITDDCIISVTGENEAYPVVLQSKEILDRYFKREINKLKKLGLIEEIEISEEEGE